MARRGRLDSPIPPPAGLADRTLPTFAMYLICVVCFHPPNKDILQMRKRNLSSFKGNCPMSSHSQDRAKIQIQIRHLTAKSLLYLDHRKWREGKYLGHLRNGSATSRINLRVPFDTRHCTPFAGELQNSHCDNSCSNLELIPAAQGLLGTGTSRDTERPPGKPAAPFLVPDLKLCNPLS